MSIIGRKIWLACKASGLCFLSIGYVVLLVLHTRKVGVPASHQLVTMQSTNDVPKQGPGASVARANYAKNMAIEGHIKPGSRQMYRLRSKHPNQSEFGLWPVPQNIADELKQVDLYYFESIMQPEESGTCGSRCVANALSLCDIQEKGCGLDAQKAYNEAKKYNYLHTKDNLSNHAVARLAASLGLEHFYVMGFYETDCITKVKPKNNPFTVTGSTDYAFAINMFDEELIQQKIIQTIRQKPEITAHFVCGLRPITNHDSGHWVLINIIKQQNKKPSLVYMDSCNVPLDQEPEAQAYLSYLYWQCLA